MSQKDDSKRCLKKMTQRDAISDDARQKEKKFRSQRNQRGEEI